MRQYRPQSRWKLRLYEIIFEADTPAGRWFDIFLILFIVASVLLAILDSVDSIHRNYGEALKVLEWVFTGIFSLEYILRLICIRKPGRYAVSFYGIVDLVSILPSYAGLIVGNLPSLLFIRVLRVLRVFRVFKLGKYTRQAKVISRALRNSLPKITVFLMGVGTLIVILGSVMHLIEGPENGFTNIPKSIYWTIVTITTVGYGDIAPQTPLGQAIAGFVMIIGYSIIAVPTGIMSVEIARNTRPDTNTQACPNCSREGHEEDAVFCKFCGFRLNQEEKDET